LGRSAGTNARKQLEPPLSSRVQGCSSSLVSWGSPRVHLLLATCSWCTSHQYALLKRGQFFSISITTTYAKIQIRDMTTVLESLVYCLSRHVVISASRWAICSSFSIMPILQH
jgi:hypothetical protein